MDPHQATDHGGQRLARLRDEAGDPVAADRLALLAANHADTEAVTRLVERRDAAGDQMERLRRYGLTDEGTISEPWD